MGYLGNNLSVQVIQPATDFFSGNGVTTTFTLTRTVQSNYGIEVVVNNVQQNPSSTYSINAANQLVFVAPPSSGTNNIYVVYNTAMTQLNSVGQGTVGTQQLASVSTINSIGNSLTLQTNNITAVTVDQSQNVTLNSNGALSLPVGTTAQRPSNAVAVVGMQRWNSTLGVMEVYVAAGTWQPIASSTFSIDYLIVAGGGSGGGMATGGSYHGAGGGGGAGGMVIGTVSSSLGTFPVVVGAGGAGSNGNVGASGSSSSVFGVSTVGGGYGARGNQGVNAALGGSGGGASREATTVAAGTSGQGNAGGNQNGSGCAGGGGGKGGNGADGAAAPGTGGNGGTGGANDYSGTTLFYAGGGGGGGGGNGGNLSGGAGGSSVGGAGGTNNGGNGVDGSAAVANRGGGGGGGSSSQNTTSSTAGGNGGSGVVIIRYLGSIAKATGGNSIVISGGYVIHTFTSSGNFVV